MAFSIDICGPKCECRRSCDADLHWSAQARSACRESCQTDYLPVSGQAWFDGLPAGQRGRFIADYYGVPEYAEAFMDCVGAECFDPGLPDRLGITTAQQQAEAIRPFFAIGIIIVLILVYIYLS